jgi:hypothetical protein
LSTGSIKILLDKLVFIPKSADKQTITRDTTAARLRTEEPCSISSEDVFDLQQIMAGMHFVAQTMKLIPELDALMIAGVILAGDK